MKKKKPEERKRPPRPGEGRPTKYDPIFIDKVDDFLAEYTDSERQIIKYEGEKTTGYDTKIVVKLPTLDRFSDYIGVNQDTLVERGHKYPKFSEALQKIKNEQKNRLLNKGLSGDYNPTIAKLILSANHGMSEKVINEQTGKNGGPIAVVDVTSLSPKQIQEKIKEML